MNNIQLSCQGNTLSKPIMCWSLGDYLLSIVVGGLIFIIVVVIIGRLTK